MSSSTPYSAINFASDNVAPMPPEMLAALAAANEGPARAYGADPWTARLTERLQDVFQTRDLACLPVATGTAANSLALSIGVPVWGAVYCHEGSHVWEDECAAPEFFIGGGRLLTLPGEGGKLTAKGLSDTLAKAEIGFVHHVQPAAVTITQASEAGTVYRPEEVAALGKVARDAGLFFHMDGARFANALAGLNCAPADVTWKAGVDALSFGATKNGAIGAETVLLFGKAAEKATELGYRRKRAGHLFSKMRYLSAQILAGLEEGRWLTWAAQANRVARHLSDGLAKLPGARLSHPTEANEIFVHLPERVIAGLEADGFVFYRWGPPGGDEIRLVAAWNSRIEDADTLLARAAHHAGASAAA